MKLLLLGVKVEKGNIEKIIKDTKIMKSTKSLDSYGAIPSYKQIIYQKEELTAFIHFGINTFTDREWGNGKECAKLFNPKNVDAKQWVCVLKEAGFKKIILTEKHHDGFSLWNTSQSTFDVSSSPWKNGKGDVVKEVSEACALYGMKFGIYLSLWDQNSLFRGINRYIL